MANGCEELGNAVVEQAVMDWQNYMNRMAEYEIKAKEVERFFLSKQFNLYSDMSGEALLSRLKEEFAEKRKAYENWR